MWRSERLLAWTRLSVAAYEHVALIVPEFSLQHHHTLTVTDSNPPHFIYFANLW